MCTQHVFDVSPPTQQHHIVAPEPSRMLWHITVLVSRTVTELHSIHLRTLMRYLNRCICLRSTVPRCLGMHHHTLCAGSSQYTQPLSTPVLRPVWSTQSQGWQCDCLADPLPMNAGSVRTASGQVMSWVTTWPTLCLLPPLSPGNPENASASSCSSCLPHMLSQHCYMWQQGSVCPSACLSFITNTALSF